MMVESPTAAPQAERSSDVGRHGQYDTEPSGKLSDAHDGREAACDAGRSVLLGLGFEFVIGKQLHRTDNHH
jgi:hypothetical protein